MDELEDAIKAYYFHTNIKCLSCHKEVNAVDCFVEKNGRITCPNCKEDICGED